MKFHILSLSLFLNISPLLGSDYLTTEQQNEEMRRAFSGENTLPRTKIDNQAPQIFEKIFPSYVDTKPTEKHSITIEQYEQIKKHAAETMFHRLNDALNFVLTIREIFLSAILKNPELIGLTCYSIGKDAEGELYFDFHLPTAPHPVAYLAQGYLTLTDYQYWIDILLLFRNTAFPNHTLSSYDHNAACAIKDLIQAQIGILKEKINTHPANSVNLAQVIDQTDNSDASFFVKTNHNFDELLQGCFKNIDDALPKGTMTQVNMSTAFSIKNKGHIVDLGKSKRQSVFEKLSPNVVKLHVYFSKNYTAILGGIRSMAVMEYITTNFTTEEVNLLLKTPFYNAAGTGYKQLLEGKFSYDILFSSLTKNMVAVQNIRKELGLPKEIFKGLNFEKEMQKALKNYGLAKQEILLEQPQHQEIIKSVKTKEKVVEAEYFADNKEKILTGPEDDQKAHQQPEKMGPILTQESQPSSIISNTTKKEEEDCVFDSSYFKLIHQYHQNQKNQNTTGKYSKQALSEYEMDLYSYLMSSIFRPEHRPTWNTLVSSLTDFGFKGKPNTLGNGSTWEFSVTEKNGLFFMNPDYKGATFNVHEFKGNEPINPRYLKFFQSGFSNVFGLTEEYIIKALKL